MPKAGVTSFDFDVAADRAADQRRGETIEGSRFPSEEDPNSPQSLTTDMPSNPEESADAQRVLAQEDAEKQAAPDEVARLKKIVGDQGNELGELRRSSISNEQLQGRIAQLEQERQQAQAPAQGEFDLFADIPDDQKFMSPSERRQVSLKFQQLAQAAATEIQRARDDGQYFAARQASGVSTAQEAALVEEHPYLNSLTGVEKAQAMADMAKLKTSAQGVTGAAANEAARSAARTASFTESSNGSGSDADSNLEPVMERLLREAKAGRHNAADLEKAMRKAGVPRYDTNGLRY